MKGKITAAIFSGLVSLLTVFPGWSAVTVDWGDEQQTIEGFGAATGDSRWGTITTTHAKKIFSVTEGAGVSLVRTGIAPDGTYPENTAALNAVAQGATPWAAPWSPPAWMKSNNSLWLGYLLPEHYQAYANYLRDWIIHQNNVGIRITALSIQNEPDVAMTGNQYTCSWSAQSFHDFVLVLGPTLEAAGLGAVRIMLPEPASWDKIAGYADLSMNDAASAAYVDIIGGHAYLGTVAPYPNGQDKGKSLWQTEYSRFQYPFDPSIGNAVNLAIQIHNYLTIAKVNAYNYWLATHSADLDEQFIWRSPDGDIVSKSLWAMGNFSKFVRPGWVRIGATANPASGVYVSAYKEASSGKFAIVVINKNSWTSQQSFALNGVTSSSVTPWITSAGLDLASQSTVSVGGSSFDYTVPAQSVVTLVGSGGTANMVSTPAISPNGGTHLSSVSVTLSCATSGATIRYTTDGSTPTSSSTAYGSAFSLSSSATVKAKAFKDGMTASGTASASFTVIGKPSLPFSMNCGPTSPAVSGWTNDDGYMTSGDDYSTDAGFITDGVTDAAPEDLYKTCSRDEPVFAIPVDNGTYTVRLHFAEPADITLEVANDHRHMTVTVEGATVLSDFSPAGAAGVVKKAYVHTVQTTVADGSLDIQLQNGSGTDSFIMGIEVIAGTVTVPEAVSLPFSMNCGPAAPTVSGWTVDDAYMTSGDDYSTDASFITDGVADAAPADLYKTCSRDEPVFAIPVDNGTYTVRLHFAEPAKATVAEADAARHMTVQVEGVTVLSDFSPAGAAGAVKKAYVHTLETTVADGSLDILLQNGSGNDSFIMGIEVLEQPISAISGYRIPAVHGNTGIYRSTDLEIYDMQGVLMQVTGGLPNGVYIIKSREAGQVAYRKVSVIR